MIYCLNITNLHYLMSYESERRMYFIVDENTLFPQEIFVLILFSIYKTSLISMLLDNNSNFLSSSYKFNIFFSILNFHLESSQSLRSCVLKLKWFHSFSIAGLLTT